MQENKDHMTYNKTAGRTGHGQIQRGVGWSGPSGKSQQAVAFLQHSDMDTRQEVIGTDGSNNCF